MKDFQNYDIIRVFDKNALERNVLKTINKFKQNIAIVVKSNSYGIGVKNALPVFEKLKILNFFCQDIIEALEVKKLLKNKNANKQ